MAQEIRPGTLLVARPTLLDPNFSRTVVLICHHDDEGSMGLIINRPTELRVGEALPDLNLPETEDVLFEGGPVQRTHLLTLHRLKRPIEGAHPIACGIELGGGPDLLEQLYSEPRADGEAFRLYLGYAGWGEKQLAGELAQGAWITCPGDSAYVFDVDAGDVWSEVLRSMGGIYRVLAEIPEDHSTN